MSGKWKRYPAYRASGVEWLGQVPEHWQVRRLKFLSSEPLAYGANEAAESTEPSNPRFIRITDIRGDGTLHDDTFRSLPEHVAKPYLLDHGDLLLARSGATVGKTFMYRRSWGRACHAGYLIRCRLRPTVAQPEFLSYFTNSAEYWGWLSSVFSQATIQNVSAEKYANLPIPVPEPEDQTAILTFLDRETAKIDALVAKKERLIELLQEKRTALISHTVTRGLNPNAPLRHSGIPWIGPIPVHWELRSLGTLLSRITYGFTNPMPVAETGPFMLTANDIGDGQIQFDSARRTTQEAYSRLLTDKSRPQAGDILITKDGTLGRIAVADGRPVCINQSVALLRPRTEVASNGFLQDALRAQCYQDCMAFNAGGTTIKHIYVSRLAKMPLALPPLQEQVTISAYIGEQRNRLDALMAKVRTAIDRLQEYRTALISAAVTGQIDVRDEKRGVWTG